MRINEFRAIGHIESETFRLFGTEGGFREECWLDKRGTKHLSEEELTEPLPPTV